MIQPQAATLPDVAFPGRDRLIAAFDAAVQCGDGHAVTAALRDAMCDAIRDPVVQLPGCVHTPVDGHYARRELYRSPVHGYSLVAMTWGPGQGTPIHDHDGLWCVEGIWRGTLEITQYALLERDAARFRFLATTGMQAGAGSAGSLIPPHEYHTIRNASPATVAVSLHVYEAPIQRCARFDPIGDGWYRRIDSALPADAAD